MIVIVFLVTVLIAFAIQQYLEKRKFYKFSENIPGERSYGILGHGPLFLAKNEEGQRSEVLQKFSKWWMFRGIPHRSRSIQPSPRNVPEIHENAQALAWTLDAMGARQRPKNDSKNFAVSNLPRKTVFLQISSAWFGLNFVKM
jgi:hypothetical protein